MNIYSARIIYAQWIAKHIASHLAERSKTIQTQTMRVVRNFKISIYSPGWNLTDRWTCKLIGIIVLEVLGAKHMAKRSFKINLIDAKIKT